MKERIRTRKNILVSCIDTSFVSQSAHSKFCSHDVVRWASHHLRLLPWDQSRKTTTSEPVDTCVEAKSSLMKDLLALAKQIRRSAATKLAVWNVCNVLFSGHSTVQFATSIVVSRRHSCANLIGCNRKVWSTTSHTAGQCVVDHMRPLYG